MAKALIYPKIFRALIDGGFITSENHVTKSTEYKVWNRRGGQVGHMSEQAMQELLEEGVLFGFCQMVCAWCW